MTEWYLNPVGGYWLSGGVAVALLALLVFLGVPRERLSLAKRWVLFGIRVVVILLLLLAMMRPTLMATVTKKQPATLLVLIDDSRSMQVTDTVGDRSRWQTLQRALAESAPSLALLGDDIQVKGYAFDANIAPLEYKEGKFALEAEPKGEQTAIGAALEDVLRREAGQRLVGVVLLSDGAQRAYAPRDTPPQTAVRRLAALGCPLYVFPIGQGRGAGQARDVAIKDLVVNQTVYVKNDLTVGGVARIDGYANEKIPVRLKFESPDGKMEDVAAEEIQSQSDGESLPIQLTHVPDTPGEYKLTLETPPRPGELITTNNHLSTFVTVLSGGLSVLDIEGDLRVEQKFLRRSLDASSDIRVDSIRIAPDDKTPHPATLAESFQPGKYDVYILGDIDSTSFSKDELERLAAVVRSGAGLLTLGGFRTYGAGGYAETPLAALLPVRMNWLERLRPDDPVSARTDLQWPGPIVMQPARPLGVRHFVMMLAPPGENEAAWKKLPPLDGANRWIGVKPSAQILADTPDGKPLLVAQEAGGRLMSFAGDSTWHWWMQGHSAEHKRFWRQVVLWLAHKDETQNNLWIKLPQRRYPPNARVEFAAAARNPQGEPTLDAKFEAVVIRPDGSRRPVPLVHSGQQLSGIFADTQAAGDYTIELTAQGEGITGTRRARFLIYEQDLELDNAAADPSLLASLAHATAAAGGQTLAPEELPTLIERIRSQPLDLDTQTLEKQSPWDTWPFFLIFVTFLCVEWTLRKRWGMV